MAGIYRLGLVLGALLLAGCATEGDSSRLDRIYRETTFGDYEQQDRRIEGDRPTPAMARVLGSSTFLVSQLYDEYLGRMKVTWVQRPAADRGSSGLPTAGRLPDDPSWTVAPPTPSPPGGETPAEAYLEDAIRVVLAAAHQDVESVSVNGSSVRIVARGARSSDTLSSFEVKAREAIVRPLQQGHLPVSLSASYGLKRLQSNPLFDDWPGVYETKLLQYLWAALMVDPALAPFRDWKLVVKNDGGTRTSAGAVAAAFRNSQDRTVEINTFLLRLAFSRYLANLGAQLSAVREKDAAALASQRAIAAGMWPVSVHSNLHEFEEPAQSGFRKFAIFAASVLGHEIGHIYLDSRRPSAVDSLEVEVECDRFGAEICRRVFGGFSMEFRDELGIQAAREGAYEVVGFRDLQKLQEALDVLIPGRVSPPEPGAQAGNR